MTKTKSDPLFAAYAATAPRLDLESYVHYAQNHRDEYSAETRAIASEMIALLNSLYARPDQASSKRAVWALIDRFKSSIQNWHSLAGASQTQTDVACWVTNARSGVLLDPKTPVLEASAMPQIVLEKPKTPSWKERAIAAEAQIREFERLQNPKPIRLASATRPVARYVALDGVKICARCQVSQPIEAFCWAAHKAERSICKSCRKLQTAERKQRAA